MKTVNDLIEELVDLPLFEMANISSKDTGLSNDNLIIYISTKQGSHGPRVKVFKKGKPNSTISFSISKEPEILTSNILKITSKEISEIKYWISINSIELLKLWNANHRTVEIFDVLRNLDKI